MHDAVRTVGLLPPAEPSMWNYYKLVRICYMLLRILLVQTVIPWYLTFVLKDLHGMVWFEFGLSLVGFVESVTRMTMQVCEGTQLYQLLLGSVGQAKLSSMPQNRRSHSKKVLQEVLRVLSRNGLTFSMLFY